MYLFRRHDRDGSQCICSEAMIEAVLSVFVQETCRGGSQCICSGDMIETVLSVFVQEP